MNDYIPLEVLENATKELIADAAKLRGPKDPILANVEALCETVHLKDPHSGIPTLYKIVIRYPHGPVEKRSVWGVWTEKGQRLQLP